MRSCGQADLFLRLLGAMVFGLVLPALSAAGAQDKIRVGYLPLLPSAHEFVAAEKGWFRELGLPVEEFRFRSGPPMTQAFIAGQLDVAYFGVGPALMAVSRGVKAKIIAGSTMNTVAVIARDPFAEGFERRPNRAAFQGYQKRTGQRVRIGTFEAGSTSYLLALYWLQQLQVDPLREMELVRMGEDQQRRTVQSKQIDIAVSVEPIITLGRRASPAYRAIAWGKDILPGQPGSVLFVRQTLLDERPDVAEKLVQLHLRATALLTEERDEAARLISRKIGADVLPVSVARETLDSPAIRWISSPHALVAGAETYNRFQVTMGLSRTPLSADDLFDFRFYDRVFNRQPQSKKY